MATTTKYTLPDPIRKTNELYRFLAGHELMGLAPGEISKGLGVSPSWVSVTLPALVDSGFIEQVDGTNRWRLGVAFVRISTTVTTNLSQSRRKLDEISQRYSVPL